MHAFVCGALTKKYCFRIPEHRRDDPRHYYGMLEAGFCLLESRSPLKRVSTVSGLDTGTTNGSMRARRLGDRRPCFQGSQTIGIHLQGDGKTSAKGFDSLAPPRGVQQRSSRANHRKNESWFRRIFAFV